MWRLLRKEDGYRLRFGNLADPAMYGWPWDIVINGTWQKFVIVLAGVRRIAGSDNIGVAAIAVDRKNRSCFIELGLLPEYRGEGLGGVAGRLMISKCFTEFGARLVESTALSTNQASIRMRDWMRYEATMKGRFLIDGQEVDELFYRITRAEWELKMAVAEPPELGIAV